MQKLFCTAIFGGAALLGVAAAEDASARRLAGEPFAPTFRRPVAEMAIAGHAVALTAYGPRSRARAVGRVREMQEARVMRRVFPGAPPPAVVTLEVRVDF